MHRSSAFILSLSVLAGSAFAGQIQIGGVNGLTSATVVNPSNWLAKNYDTYLFNGANNGSPIVPYTSYQQHLASAGTITDSTNGVTFSMINDGCVGGACNGTTTNSANFWASAISGPSTLTIPIGIADVTDVWTMLNNEYGMPGLNDTTVKFNFGSTGTTADGPTLTINLVNASSNRSSNSGQIGSGTECTGVGTSTCNTFAIGGLASSTPLGGITVDSNTVFSTNYNSTIVGFNGFAGSTAGSLSLYDQGFIFGSAYASYYLVNVQVLENVGAYNSSMTALSAITVDSAAPEPSTVWLGFAGMIGAGLVVARRRRLA